MSVTNSYYYRNQKQIRTAIIYEVLTVVIFTIITVVLWLVIGVADVPVNQLKSDLTPVTSTTGCPGVSISNFFADKLVYK
jgi:hypothetical protein